jgi:hypothetical protein
VHRTLPRPAHLLDAAGHGVEADLVEVHQQRLAGRQLGLALGHRAALEVLRAGGEV